MITFSALTYRQLLRYSMFLVFFSGLVFTSFAQNRKYDLLWKISGKNLKQPSYLFGSMHVKNRKAFNFSDSVMRSIAKTSAFVLELHPDSMLQSLYRDPRSQSLKAELTDEQKEILQQKYQEKYGKAPDDETLYHPLLVRGLLNPDVSEDDDMSTFLDAYLYGIARTQGKKIFGLEKTEDQVATLDEAEDIEDMFDADEEASKDAFSKLLGVYANGGLNEIDEYLSLYPIESLTSRNRVMLTGILDLLKRETLFICVGVAHLPGDKGLIAMLKEEGYQVSLENASFTGVASKYKIDPKKIKWYNYESDVFKASFPSMPVLAMENYDSKLVHYPDLMSGLNFSVVTTYNPSSNRLVSIDSIFSYMINKNHFKVLRKQEINKNGVRMLEVELEKKGKRSIGRIFYEHDYLFATTIENLPKDTDPIYLQKFFDSFMAIKPKEKASKWNTKTYVEAAFSVNVPVEVKEQVIEKDDSESKTSTKINMFVAPDYNRHINYIYRYNDFPKRYYLADKNAVLDGTIKQLAARGTVAIPAATIYRNGLEGRSIELIVENTYMQAETFVRGNRQYLLLKQNLAGPVKAVDDEYFNSFKILPYHNIKGTSFAIKNISTTWPDKPDANPEDEVDHESFILNTQGYHHSNKNSGGMYSFEYSELSKYYRNPSVDSLQNIFTKTLNNNLVELKETTFVSGGISGKEIIGLDTLSGNIKKTRFWLQDNHMVVQQAIASKEEVEGPVGRAFFDDLKTNSKAFTFNLAASKANILMQDLKDVDSNINKAAKGALNFYLFEKDELPLIKQGLQRNYEDDTLSTGTRAHLIDAIVRLGDKKSVSLFKDLYHNIKTHDEVKGKLLVGITSLDSTQYDWYLTTLNKSDLKIKEYWGMLSPLVDSLAYLKVNFEPFLQLFDKKVYRPVALSALSQFMAKDSATNHIDLAQKHANKITKYAMSDLDEDIVKLNADDYPTTIYTYLNILPNLNKNLTEEFTDKVLGIDSIKYLKTMAVEAKIKAGLKVNELLLAEQLDSLFSRATIMRAYDGIGLLSKVPEKYRKPSEFGRMLVYENLSEEYEIGDIALVGEIEDAGNIYYVYSHQMLEDEDELKYVSVVGAFDKNSNEINFTKQYAYTDLEILKEDWRTQAKTIIEKMKSMNKGE